MTALRTVLAVAFLLAAPGWLMVRALFGGQGPRDAERLAVAIGCSLSLVVAAGLVLQLTPGGISSSGWDWAIGGELVALAAIVAVRARGAGGESTRLRGQLIHSGGRLAALAAPCLLVAAMGAAALVIAHKGAAAVARRSSFTQLWLVPRPGGAQLGVRSFEHSTLRFTVTVTANGRILKRSRITLAPGSKFVREIALRPVAAKKRLEARLFLAAGTVPYRTVVWNPPGGAGG
jgi:Protein of unknown function (DUF1616)